MKRKLIHIIFWMISLHCLAQNSTLFLMSEVPQSNFVNPAVQPSWKWIVGVPGLSSLYSNYSNSAFTLNDSFAAHSSSTTISDIVDDMQGVEVVLSEAQYTPIYGGFKYNKYFFNFSISERAASYTTVPADLAKVAWYGNADYLGKISLSGLGSKETHWREYSFGVSRRFSRRLTLGLHSKVLFGKGILEMPNTQGYIFTDENDYSLSLDLDAQVRSSLPVDVLYRNDGYVSRVSLKENMDWVSYGLNRKNRGVAFDFGFLYQLDARTTLSASMLNLGFIRWNYDVNTLSVNSSYTFAGFDATDGDYFDEITDSVTSQFEPKISTAPFWSTLTPELYLGLNHQLSSQLNGGVVLYGRLLRNKFHPALTISASTYGNQRLTSSISYTVLEGEYFNIGGGLGLQLGSIHLHAAADNILGFLKMADQGYLNLRFGISIVPNIRPRYNDFCKCFERWEGRKANEF